MITSEVVNVHAWGGEPFKLTVPGGPYLSTSIRDQGVWEPEITALMRQWLTPGDTFVDVGSNCGYHSCVAARLVGEQGHVLAVEAHPDLARMTAANLGTMHTSRNRSAAQPESESTRHYVIVNRAAWGTDGDKINFYPSPQFAGDGRCHTTPGRTESIPVLTSRIDSLTDLVLKGMPHIRCLKIDVQGVEPQVLAGATELLKAGRTDYIVVEFCPGVLRECDNDPWAFLDGLLRLGLVAVTQCVKWRQLAESVGHVYTPAVDSLVHVPNPSYLRHLFSQPPADPLGGMVNLVVAVRGDLGR